MLRPDDAGMNHTQRFPLHRRTSQGRAGRRGQSLVEFALVFPIFFTLLIAIIEFSLVYNAQLSVNFATREAALAAAEAGNAAGGDCAILRSIEDTMAAPTSDEQVSEVVVYLSDTVGSPVPAGAPMKNTYRRGGAMVCPRAGNPTATVAFTLVGSAGYPEGSRCNTLAGCGVGRPLDHVGVQMTYVYTWHTPLASFIGLGGTGYIMVGSNAMRMEPVL